ncbi:MAG: exodeoxyribonuclease III [Pseudomonadota bacterium]
MVRIATWNVNSVKARLPHLIDFLNAASPDVLLLQELKCVTGDFPRLETEAAGYHAEVVGQKTYNGVAILAKHGIADALRALPGDPSDDQARYLEASVGNLRVASIYLPNGNPVDSPKFPYKLAFMERLHARTRALLAAEQAFVLGGDWNVAPTDDDVYDPEGWRNDALCRPESRAAFRKIVYLGLSDAYRALHPQPHAYSYWDYQQNRWARDEGLRIDHLLLSPQAADRLKASGIDKGPRAKDRASDHTPVWCELGDRS